MYTRKTGVNKNNNMKNTALFVLIYILASCGTINAQNLESQFDSAYQTNDTMELKEVVDVWYETIKPQSVEEINKTEISKAIHGVYKAFYRPKKSFNSLVKSQYHGPDMKKDYFVIQNKIHYFVDKDTKLEDSVLSRKLCDSICNFKPRLYFPSKKILYYTPKYKIALTGFLKEKSSEHADFLNAYIEVEKSHSDDSWYCITQPKVHVIIFNKDLNEATVQYSDGSMGGGEVFVMSDGDWFFKESKNDWIK